MSTTFFDRAAVAGFDGYLDFTRTMSPDGKQITVSASSPVLANRDLRCIEYTLRTRTRKSASNINSDYDESCGCWYVNQTLDEVGEGTYSKFFWFAGFRPVKQAAPAPVTPAFQKVKSRTRLRPVGRCRRIDLSNWSATPDSVADAERPFGGRLRFSARRKGFLRRKSIRVMDGASPSVRRLRLGIYRVRAQYSGDSYRLKSNLVSKRVRVRSCR